MMLTQADGGFTALLVKKTPFTPGERQRLTAWAESSPYFDVSAAPALNPTKANFYQLFLSLDDARLEDLFARAHPFDVRPTTDDWPFPFKYSYWSHLFSSDPVVQGSMPVMQYSVVLLTLLIGTIACLCIFLPLWRLASAGLSSPGSLRFGIFFAGTGLGYLALEMALLQKFSLFLGHPNYALSVVLAVLLVSTGLGSLYSERIVGTLGGLRFVSYALAFLVLLEVPVLLPRLPSLIGLPFWLKTAITFALVLPLGLCLGVFVPTALERLKATSPAYVPWAWGINGIFSVLAPVLSVALSMTAGVSALMLAAVPVYLVVGFALPAPAGQDAARSS
jgi:hypothetical protein